MTDWHYLCQTSLLFKFSKIKQNMYSLLTLYYYDPGYLYIKTRQVYNCKLLFTRSTYNVPVYIDVTVDKLGKWCLKALSFTVFNFRCSSLNILYYPFYIDSILQTIWAEHSTGNGVWPQVLNNLVTVISWKVLHKSYLNNLLKKTHTLTQVTQCIR